MKLARSNARKPCNMGVVSLFITQMTRLREGEQLAHSHTANALWSV